MLLKLAQKPNINSSLKELLLAIHEEGAWTAFSIWWSPRAMTDHISDFCRIFQLIQQFIKISYRRSQDAPLPPFRKIQ